MREAWRKNQGFGALPVVDHGLVFLALDDPRAKTDKGWPFAKRTTTALSLETGKPIWRHGPSIPVASGAAGLLVNLTDRAGGIALLGPDSGQPIGSIPGLGALQATVVGDAVVASTFRDPRYVLYGASLSRWKVSWELQFGDDNRLSGVFAATPEKVVFSTSDQVVAVGLNDGREMWRHSLADLGGSVQGGIVAFPDSVVFLAGQTVAKVDLATGKRIWSCRPESGIWTGYSFGNRYYAIGISGQYSVVDLDSGTVVFLRQLQSQLPHKPGMGSLCPPIAVSDTHLFTGNRGGYLCAFERDTGEFVWAGRPKGGCSTEIVGSYFAVVDEWLFYYDHSMTVYCMRGSPSSRESERAHGGWARKLGNRLLRSRRTR